MRKVKVYPIKIAGEPFGAAEILTASPICATGSLSGRSHGGLLETSQSSVDVYLTRDGRVAFVIWIRNRQHFCIFSQETSVETGDERDRVVAGILRTEITLQR